MAADRSGILDIVVAVGLFAPDEVGIVDDLLREHLGAPDHDDHRCYWADGEDIVIFRKRLLTRL